MPIPPFTFRNGRVAHTYGELIDLCRQYPEDACYHLFEKHFEAWFKYINDADAGCFLEACSFVYRKKYYEPDLSAQTYIDLFIVVYKNHHKEPFVFRSGQVAHTYEELFDLCQQYPEEGAYHLHEGHFEPWINYVDRSDKRFFLSACGAVRTSKSLQTAQEQMQALLTECEWQRDFERKQGDGQNWVAGWD